MKKLLCLLLLTGVCAFGDVLPPAHQTFFGVKLLNVGIRDMDGYKGPIFLVKYSPTAEAKWVRPEDPTLNNALITFALTAISLDRTITIATGGTDNFGFRSIIYMKFDDPTN